MTAGSDPAAALMDTVMDSGTKQWLLAAAKRAPERFPGAVGELVRQELLSWMVFGHRLGSSLIMRVADELHADPARSHEAGLRSVSSS